MLQYAYSRFDNAEVYLNLAMWAQITETWFRCLPRGLQNLAGEEVPEAGGEDAAGTGRHRRSPVPAAASWLRQVPAAALR